MIETLDARGLEAWWVLDQWEESVVRSRFPDVPEAALDWPPRVEGGPLMRTRAWRIADLRSGERRDAMAGGLAQPVPVNRR